MHTGYLLGSHLVETLSGRFPRLVWVNAAVLEWTASPMMIEDEPVIPCLEALPRHGLVVLGAVVLLVRGLAYLLNNRHSSGSVGEEHSRTAEWGPGHRPPLRQARNGAESVHVTKSVIADLEQRWGGPAQVELAFPMHEEEWRLVARTAARGRVHDVTMFTLHHGSVAVIRKPSYRQGIWRAPSGGVAPGEAVEAGAARECWEETGLRTEVQRYLLRSTVVFSRGAETVTWQSHVLQMRYLSGTPCPVDTHEVAEARWATLEELDGPIRAAMLATGSGGLAYRAELQALVSPLLR